MRTPRGLVTVVAVAGVVFLAWWAPWTPLLASLRVPDGFREYRTDDFRLAHPEKWTIREGTDDHGFGFVEFSGPPTRDGVYSGQVRVVVRHGFGNRLDDHLIQFRAAAGRGGYRVLSEKPVRVVDAERAHRFDVEQRVTAGTGAVQRQRGTRTFVLLSNSVLIDLAALGPSGPERAAQLAAITKSLEPLVRSKPTIFDRIRP